MLVGVEMAGTPGAGLHLIEYQGGMMAIAEGTQRLQERRVRRITPPSPIIGSTITAQVREIAAVTASISFRADGYALRQRSIIAGIFRLAANGDGEQRAAGRRG